MMDDLVSNDNTYAFPKAQPTDTTQAQTHARSRTTPTRHVPHAPHALHARMRARNACTHTYTHLNRVFFSSLYSFDNPSPGADGSKFFR